MASPVKSGTTAASVASSTKITMRSLDFRRCENGLIRENRVLVDLLHVYEQIGVDMLARMREFIKARSLPG